MSIFQVDKIVTHEGTQSDLGWVSLSDALNVPLILPGENGEITAQKSNPTGNGSERNDSLNQQNNRNIVQLGLAERENALSSFVQDGWLAEASGAPASCYTLGPRAILELGHTLLEEEELANGPRELLKKALGC